MKDRHETGQIGETIAEAHLLSQGYEIVATNYRHKRAEIDLIARKNDRLFFVEVKTRRTLRHGHPTAAITEKKERLMAKAAAHYMYEVHHEWAFRFDVISVVLHPNGSYDLDHLEDAFFPGLH